MGLLSKFNPTIRASLVVALAVILFLGVRKFARKCWERGRLARPADAGTGMLSEGAGDGLRPTATIVRGTQF